MGWVPKGQKLVYIRSRRVGRTFQKDYFGSGAEAHLAAALDAQRRRDALQQRESRRAERTRWDTAGAVLAELIALSDLLARAALLAAGYHQHDRGQWRKKTMETATEPAKANAETATRLEELVRRAQRGDEAVLPELRKALDADPSIWQGYGDLAARAQDAWMRLLTGQDLFGQGAIARKLDELRAELGGSSPSPLEKLLVDRIAACWVHVHVADALFANVAQQRAGAAALREPAKHQESAQRRYLAAIKQLALVRKLIKPSPSPIDLLRPVEEQVSPALRRGSSSPPLRVAAEVN